jgi:hypothetical protein
MSCPNDDPNFSKMLSNIGISTDPITRRALYYTVCIFTRLLIAFFVLYNLDKLWLQYALLILSFFAIINLAYGIRYNNKTQWWSKKFQLIMAILLFITTGFIIYTNNNSKRILLPIILFISLFGGIAQSLFVASC